MKITENIIESYLNCRYKSYLKLTTQNGERHLLQEKYDHDILDYIGRFKEFLIAKNKSIVVFDTNSNPIEIVKSKAKTKDGLEIENTEYELLSFDTLEIDTGIIASGESVIEHSKSSVGELLTQAYDNAQVVEMEGFGFAKSALEHTTQTRIEYVGLVRGISDKIKKTSLTDAQENPLPDNRPKEVKDLASATAAAYTYYLIYKIFETRESEKKNS